MFLWVCFGLAYMHSFVLFFKFYVYIISCICLILPVLYHISLGVEHFICSLIPMGKGPKLMKPGVGASDRVEKDEDSPFLRICYPGYCTLGFVPRKQKRLWVHSRKPQILKHHPEIPQSVIICVQLAYRNNLFFPSWTFFGNISKTVLLVGHSFCHFSYWAYNMALLAPK